MKMEEMLATIRRELEQVRVSTHILELVKKIEVAEVGIQASPDMVDATIEPQAETLVEEKKKKRQRQNQGKRKEKEGAKLSLYEDLSDYEKELSEAPVTPLVTKKQPIKR
ncbi:hypothetical protein BGX38DRAFT_1263863 [Terfezia claveryi]|nr:hypothetical protein BGX38DRAFT_1263863 [Terfezia claveryi]